MIEELGGKEKIEGVQLIEHDEDVYTKAEHLVATYFSNEVLPFG